MTAFTNNNPLLETRITAATQDDTTATATTTNTKVSSSRTKNATNIITAPLGPYDILCGRSKGAHSNIGNRRFRVTMSINLPAYLEGKSRQEKSVLINAIVTYLQDEAGARFLKPQKGLEDGYVELTQKQAREKVGHALRDMAVAQEKSNMTEWTQKKFLEHNRRKEQRHQQHAELMVGTTSSSSTHSAKMKTSSSSDDDYDDIFDDDLEPLPMIFNSWPSY